ncbi:hypothetical protein PS3A_41930 [Pseudomonas sp. 3A(2025)]
MSKPIWGDLPPFTIRPSSITKKSTVSPTSAQAFQVLSEVGENAIALNSLAMEKSNMKKLFKGFDPEHITPRELSKAGTLLYKSGFIDNLTADLMNRAGAEFDKAGKVINADEPINALEFLANQIVIMREKTAWGDPYAQTLMPDYVRAIHVIQNLQAFASSGDSYEMQKSKAAQRDGIQ